MGDLPRHDLQVDRSRALVRGFLWACMTTILGSAAWWIGTTWIGASQMRWTLLWENQPATFVALVTILACAGIAAAICGVAAARWFVLAAWPGHLHIRVSPDSVRLRLGPFGSSTFTWDEMRLTTFEDIDPDTLVLMPDEFLAIELRHPASDQDLANVMQRFANVDAEALNRILRPYLMRGIERRIHDDQ